MRIIFLIIFFSIFTSCYNDNSVIRNLEYGIINKTGIYYTKDKKITIKEFVEGTITYVVSDKMNNLLYQHDTLKAFSKNSFWCLYYDKQGSLWVFNTDYNDTLVWFEDEINSEYINKDFCKEKISIPNEFKYLLEKNVGHICR